VLAAGGVSNSSNNAAVISKSIALCMTDSTRIELDLTSDSNRVLVAVAPPSSFSDAAAAAAATDMRELPLTLTMTGGFDVPFSVDVSYMAEKPLSGARCAVQLATALSANRVKEGETVGCTVTVSNTSAEAGGVGMVVAVVGVPAGLEARADQLRELVKEGRIACFELKNREIILYWRGMAPLSSKTVPLSLLAIVPGQFRGPASRAYVYYDDDERHWIDPMSVVVTA